MNYSNYPPEVVSILRNHEQDDNTYENCQALQDELEQIGWTCDWGLDAVPYGIRKLKSDKPTLSGDSYECSYCGEIKELLMFNALEQCCKECYQKNK